MLSQSFDKEDTPVSKNEDDREKSADKLEKLENMQCKMLSRGACGFYFLFFPPLFVAMMQSFYIGSAEDLSFRLSLATSLLRFQSRIHRLHWH